MLVVVVLVWPPLVLMLLLLLVLLLLLLQLLGRVPGLLVQPLVQLGGLVQPCWLYNWSGHSCGVWGRRGIEVWP